MKIPASMRALYERQFEINKQLQARVDTLLRNHKPGRWHYESRIKQQEAFALKLETGRVHDPSRMEDFFACTLVVPNSTSIDEAEALISREFLIKERRPKSAKRTHKEPYEFPFDDLRLYVHWRTDPSTPPLPIDGVVFEIQVKTYLEHAWSIATHDLVYKTSEPNWAKARIAFQIRAMLEHAEVSIQQAEALSAASKIAKDNAAFQNLSLTIAILKELWSEADLPADLRRLAENVMGVCDALDLKPSDLKTILEKETELGRGALTRNLSPFGSVVATLLVSQEAKFRAHLTKPHQGRRNLRIFLPPEIELPASMNPKFLLNAIIYHPVPETRPGREPAEQQQQADQLTESA